jgi:hypothetical protein
MSPDNRLQGHHRNVGPNGRGRSSDIKRSAVSGSAAVDGRERQGVSHRTLSSQDPGRPAGPSPRPGRAASAGRNCGAAGSHGPAARASVSAGQLASGCRGNPGRWPRPSSGWPRPCASWFQRRLLGPVRRAAVAVHQRPLAHLLNRGVSLGDLRCRARRRPIKCADQRGHPVRRAALEPLDTQVNVGPPARSMRCSSWFRRSAFESQRYIWYASTMPLPQLCPKPPCPCRRPSPRRSHTWPAVLPTPDTRTFCPRDRRPLMIATRTPARTRTDNGA